MQKQDPPMSSRGRQSQYWIDCVAEMRADRGTWYNIGNYSPGVPTQIRRGDYKAFLDPNDLMPPDVQMANNWEVTTRKAGEDRRLHLFIRYIGD